jgi:hypothetical protein
MNQSISVLPEASIKIPTKNVLSKNISGQVSG